VACCRAAGTATKDPRPLRDSSWNLHNWPHEHDPRKCAKIVVCERARARKLENSLDNEHTSGATRVTLSAHQRSRVQSERERVISLIVGHEFEKPLEWARVCGGARLDHADRPLCNERRQSVSAMFSRPELVFCVVWCVHVEQK
jgi:hypothetical protein